MRGVDAHADGVVDSTCPMHLILPSPQWQTAFQDMARDYASAGELRYALALRDFPAFLREVERDHSHDQPPGRVPALQFWLADGDTLLGRSTLRLQLTAALGLEGGHIGYDVRPSARRRGVGTELLRLTLFEARTRGIARALVTCDSDNLGSRAIIERNRGVLEGESRSKDSGKLVARYWIEAVQTATSP